VLKINSIIVIENLVLVESGRKSYLPACSF